MGKLMKTNQMPKRFYMSVTESMEELYKIAEKLENAQEARQLLVAIFSNVLSEIQDEGLEVTAQEVEKRLQNYLNDFIEAAKKTHVA